MAFETESGHLRFEESGADTSVGQVAVQAGITIRVTRLAAPQLAAGFFGVTAAPLARGKGSARMTVLTLIQGEGGVVGHRFPIILFLVGNDLQAGYQKSLSVILMTVHALRLQVTGIALSDIASGGFEGMDDPEP